MELQISHTHEYIYIAARKRKIMYKFNGKHFRIALYVKYSKDEKNLFQRQHPKFKC